MPSSDWLGPGAKAFTCIHSTNPSRMHGREACLLMVPWRVEASLGAALPWVQASCGLCFDRTGDSWSRGPCLGRSRSEIRNPQRGTPGSPCLLRSGQEHAPHIKVLLFPPFLFNGNTSGWILGYVVLTSSSSQPPKPHRQEHLESEWSSHLAARSSSPEAPSARPWAAQAGLHLTPWAFEYSS